MNFVCEHCHTNADLNHSIQLANGKTVCSDCVDRIEATAEAIKICNHGEAGCGFISNEYIDRIADNIAEDVLINLESCADPDWNDDDLRLAIGRILCDRLGLES